METSQLSLLNLEPTTSSPSDRHAKIFQAPIPTGEGWKVNDRDCSLKQSGCFAWFDPDTQSLRTLQMSLPKMEGNTLSRFSGRFLRAGMMRNGKLYQRQAWVRRTYGRGSSLLPTPTARDHKDCGANTDFMKIAKKGKLAGVIKTMNTSTTGELSPEFVEWMQGYPAGWTELED